MKKDCKIPQCNRITKARGYCDRHLGLIYRRGEIPKRIRTDPNEFVEKEDVFEIVLYDTLGYEKARAIIDKQSIDKVIKFKWHLNKNGYPVTRIDRSKQIFLHHLLMGRPLKGFVVDHINGNPLDNKIGNLRIVTRQQNQMNLKMRSDNKSGCTGVHWSKKENRWKAVIRNEVLGYFKSLEEAIKARKEAEKIHFGEFRRNK